MKTAFWVLVLVFFIASSGVAQAGHQAGNIPNKKLCVKMLRFGKEAYLRGRYLDAKEFFRKAIQADPSSMKAWQFYDLAVIFALAEKAEKNNKLIMPDRSTRQELNAPPDITPPPPSPENQREEPGMIIEDDEGC